MYDLGFTDVTMSNEAFQYYSLVFSIGNVIYVLYSYFFGFSRKDLPFS